MSRLLLFAACLIDTYYILVGGLGTLQGTYQHIVVVRGNEREHTSQVALVLVGTECFCRAVEDSSLTHGLGLIELTLMAYQTIGEDMPPHILLGLIAVAVARAWRIDERMAQRVVIGLVPSIAGIIENGDAIAARAVGEVGPFVAVDLELVVAVVASLHAAQTQIVGSFSIADAQGELGLQQRVRRVPVDVSLEINAMS